jgi:hypothetical protein
LKWPAFGIQKIKLLIGHQKQVLSNENEIPRQKQGTLTKVVKPSL